MEETGYIARRLVLLGEAATSPGLTSETVSFFHAVDVKQISAGGGVEGEDIQVHLVKLMNVDAWLRRQIRLAREIDCKVYAGLHFANRRPPGRVRR